jgi:ATP-dependent helicase/nuclease subunit A
MGINLTPAQSETLEQGVNILIEAGAGSGKTTVFIQRFITLLAENPKLTADKLLGITYTNLAASELLLKLRETIVNDNHPALSNDAFKERLLDQLHLVPFMTIHGLCAQICKTFPFQGNIDPEFSICDELQSSLLTDRAISTTIASLSEVKHAHLLELLLVYSAKQLSSLLKQLLRQRLASAPHATAYINQADISHFMPSAENSSFSTKKAYLRLQSLSYVFLECTTNYQHIKKQENVLDYDDLILITLSILEDKHCLQTLQETYRYIMVDEFQDTDQYQWTIIQLLCDDFRPLEKDKLFLVGDVKQSIYSFRHADPSIFMSVFNKFKSSPYSTKVIHMSDNFRSRSHIIEFINTLFSALFHSDTEAIPYTPLVPFFKDPSTITIGLFEDYTSFKDEVSFISRWILLQLEAPNVSPSDIAILTRRKIHFDTIKSILNEYGIPVSVDIQMNFFRRDHILDLVHVIEFFISPHQPLSLFSILRSPLIGISEETLFCLNHTHKKLSLFDQLHYISTSDRIQSRIAHLKTALTLSKKLTVTQSLTQFLELLNSEDQSSKNLNEDQQLFLTLLDEWEETFLYNRIDLLTHLKHCIETNYTPPVKQTATEGIRLLTIHSAKGLEFPIVIIPELHHPFNFSKQASLLITKEGLGLHCSDLPERNEYKDYLLALQEDAILEEEKRLFYVACTRAKEHLLFTGNACPKKEKPSYLTFLNRFTPTDDTPIIRYSSIFKISKTKSQYSNTYPSKDEKLPPTTASSFPEDKLPCPAPLKPHLSVSQIEAYFRCPKHYWYDYLFQSFNKQQSSHLSIERGTLTHALIEEINKKPKQPPKPLIKSILTHANSRNDNNEDLHSFLETQLNNYMSSDLFREVQSHIFLSEKGFTFRFQELTIEGRFDLVIFEEKTVHIIDFKTDKPGTKNNYETQLLIYMLALSKLYPDYTLKASVYLTQNNTLKTIEWNDDIINTFSKSLASLITALTTKKFTPPKPDICEQCPLFKLDKHCNKKELSL